MALSLRLAVLRQWQDSATASKVLVRVSIDELERVDNTNGRVALQQVDGVKSGGPLDIHEVPKPGFARRDVCLQCHQGPATLGVPGIFISSVYPGPTGMPAFRAGAYATDHRSPLDKRWGGWYVTGLHGSQHHMGNAVALDAARPELLELQGTQNLTSLAKKVDLSGYLEKTSDIVALMTYEHQTHLTNLLTRIGWEQRIAEHDGKASDELDRRV